MFDHEAYLKELREYRNATEKSMTSSGEKGYYDDALYYKNIVVGLNGAIGRASKYVKPDPAPVQPPSEKVLNEFADWLMARQALTAFVAFPGTDAEKELKVYHAIIEELKHLAKKYPKN